jgi:hypothetical protein
MLDRNALMEKARPLAERGMTAGLAWLEKSDLVSMIGSAVALRVMSRKDVRLVRTLPPAQRAALNIVTTYLWLIAQEQTRTRRVLEMERKARQERARRMLRDDPLLSDALRRSASRG